MGFVSFLHLVINKQVKGICKYHSPTVFSVYLIIIIQHFFGHLVVVLYFEQELFLLSHLFTEFLFYFMIYNTSLPLLKKGQQKENELIPYQFSPFISIQLCLYFIGFEYKNWLTEKIS